MNRRTAARLGWSLFGLSALLLAVASLLNLRRPQYPDLLATTGELLLGLVILLSFGWFGALIVARRPSQPIGWILCALAATLALTFFANEYAIYGLITHPGARPGRCGPGLVHHLGDHHPARPAGGPAAAVPHRPAPLAALALVAVGGRHWQPPVHPLAPVVMAAARCQLPTAGHL